MFGRNGEVVRYVRDLLLMVWEDLPVRMDGDALHVQFMGRGGQGRVHGLCFIMGGVCRGSAGPARVWSSGSTTRASLIRAPEGC